MAKQTAASEPQEGQYKATRLHLPTNVWELLTPVDFERAGAKGGRASVAARLVEMIEKDRKRLELEPGETVR